MDNKEGQLETIHSQMPYFSGLLEIIFCVLLILENLLDIICSG